MKNWISDSTNMGDIVEQTPTDIEQTTTDDVIECTGWWKAGVLGGTDGMVVEIWSSAKGGGGDDIYYVKKWWDSSGNGNHLLDSTLGQGPQIYGSDANYLGSASDEVGDGTTNYPVAHFTNVTTGNAQGQLFLECTPSVSYDFRINEGAEPLLTFVAVCRHHYDEDDLEANLTGTYLLSTNMGMVVSSRGTSSSNIEGHWSIGFTEGNSPNIDGACPLQAAFSFHESGSGSNATSANVYENFNATVGVPKEQWGILGFWQTSIGVADDDDQENAQVTAFLGSSHNANSTQTNAGGTPNESDGISGVIVSLTGEIIVGSFEPPQSSVPRQRLEGRIVEMVCWKSDNPIPAYKRAQVLQYFKNKFSNDI